MKIILTHKLIKENHAVKKLSKYVTTCNYIDKILIVLNITTGEVCIISYATAVGAPVRDNKCWIYYCIFFSNKNDKKIIKKNKKQKEKA